MEEDSAMGGCNTRTSTSNSKEKKKKKKERDSSSSCSSSCCCWLWLWDIINDKYTLSAAKASLILILLLTFTLLLPTRWSLLSRSTSNSMRFTFPVLHNTSINYPKTEEYILKCTSSNMTITCPANYPPEPEPESGLKAHSERTCPEYFRWIHEDLKIWRKNGIEKHMVESLNDTAHFRLVIVNGTAYVKNYTKSWQSRDIFTLWGILQLVKSYPGRLPDLDLMFHCNDDPLIKKDDYPGERSAFAPPLFQYCGDNVTFSIVFPDWSFWGWPEFGMKPWVSYAKDLEKGNSMKEWTTRKPYAFWRGTIFNGARQKLVECASIKHWSADIQHLAWANEFRKGFTSSDVSKQCLHRYKIYVEGITWSVSEKFILACDSMTLFVEPVYYDVFTRGLIPMKHYFPISPRNLCKSIKFAVEWGNNNTDKAQEIGKAGSAYVLRQIKMEDVYDYMFHLLNEYSKLLKYKPTVPEGALELCSEKFACSPMGRWTDLKMRGMVNGPAEDGPCSLPPPYDPKTLETLEEEKAKIKEVVEMWVNGTHLSSKS